MADKFPEAFKRFESQRNIKDMRFADILRTFAEWQGYRPTGKQERSLVRETSGFKKVEHYKQMIHYKTGDRFIIRNKKTGKFYKPV